MSKVSKKIHAITKRIGMAAMLALAGTNIILPALQEDMYHDQTTEEFMSYVMSEEPENLSPDVVILFDEMYEKVVKISYQKAAQSISDLITSHQKIFSSTTLIENSVSFKKYITELYSDLKRKFEHKSIQLSINTDKAINTLLNIATLLSAKKDTINREVFLEYNSLAEEQVTFFQENCLEDEKITQNLKKLAVSIASAQQAGYDQVIPWIASCNSKISTNIIQPMLMCLHRYYEIMKTKKEEISRKSFHRQKMLKNAFYSLLLAREYAQLIQVMLQIKPQQEDVRASSSHSVLNIQNVSKGIEGIGNMLGSYIQPEANQENSWGVAALTMLQEASEQNTKKIAHQSAHMYTMLVVNHLCMLCINKTLQLLNQLEIQLIAANTQSKIADRATIEELIVQQTKNQLTQIQESFEEKTTTLNSEITQLKQENNNLKQRVTSLEEFVASIKAYTEQIPEELFSQYSTEK